MKSMGAEKPKLGLVDSARYLWKDSKDILLTTPGKAMPFYQYHGRTR